MFSVVQAVLSLIVYTVNDFAYFVNNVDVPIRSDVILLVHRHKAPTVSVG